MRFLLDSYAFQLLIMAGIKLKLELAIHPLCPYAQRAMYINSFKKFPAEVILVSTADPPAWFLDLNPLGEVPALKVTKGTETFRLSESLNISEYLDSFPGPHLYPYLECGQIDYLSKSLIDVFIKNKVGRFLSAFYGYIYSATFTPEQQKEIEESFKEINNYVEYDHYVMSKILSNNSLTFADVMLLPFVERVFTLFDLAPQFVKDLDLENLRNWYKKISGQDWAEQAKATEHHLKNLYTEIRNGGYEGLKLPLSLYD